MNKPLSQDEFRQAFKEEFQDTAVCILVKFSSKRWSKAITITSSNIDLEYKGDIYKSTPFEFSDPPDESGGARPDVSITIYSHQKFIDEIEDSAGLEDGKALIMAASVSSLTNRLSVFIEWAVAVKIVNVSRNFIKISLGYLNLDALLTVHKFMYQDTEEILFK